MSAAPRPRRRLLRGTRATITETREDFIFGSEHGSVLGAAVRSADFGAMRVHQPATAEAAIEVLRERSARDGKVELLRALDDEGGNTFFSCLFGNSPYLTRLILRDTEFAEALVLQHPDTLAARVTAGLSEADPAMNRDRLMRLLRKQRSRVTILAAVLDCFGIRDVMACAGMLASMADKAVRLAAEHLLLDRVARGELGEPEGDAGARRFACPVSCVACTLIGPLPPSQELRSLASKPSASPDSSPSRKCAYC